MSRKRTDTVGALETIVRLYGSRPSFMIQNGEINRATSPVGTWGLRAMLTHAKDEDAKSFYEKYGFEASPTNELHLMLSIKDIRANLI